MIKHFSLFFLFTVLSFFLFGQDTSEKASRSSIGISSTFIGAANIITFHAIDGGGSYDGDNYYTINLNYLYTLNQTFQLETGIEYGKYHFNYSGISGDGNPYQYEWDYYLLSIPATVRINFKKFYYFNAGFSFDFNVNDQSNDIDQSGIGALMGLGFNYPFKSGLGLFANPYMQLHHIIDFKQGNNAYKMFKGGIRIGATYTF